MSKYIKIVWNITEEISIWNSANSIIKNTNSLEKDNKKFIKILDYWTNLFERHFEIPPRNYDMMWVDLIYNSPLKEEKILLDIKTQINIKDHLNLYLREFSHKKLNNRNYIIFNKKDSNTIYWKIFFIDSSFTQTIKQDKLFSNFLKKLEIFDWLTQNFISKDEKLNNEFNKIKNEFNNKEFFIENTKILIKFLQIRKDKNWEIWNTNFLENIKLKIKI